MSPTEAQLRAALREGAGGGVDADLIIANAERYRRARRHRMTNLAAAASVVGLLVIGGTALALNKSDEQASGSGGAAAAAPPARPTNAGASGGAGERYDRRASSAPAKAPFSSLADGAAAACPSRPAAVTAPVPALGRTDLLPAHVARITACGYGPDAVRAHGALVLTGMPAGRVVDALNGAAFTPLESRRSCGSADDRSGRVALLPEVAGGRTARTVLVTVGCGQVTATNGVAVRYLRTIPTELSPLVR